MSNGADWDAIDDLARAMAATEGRAEPCELADRATQALAPGGCEHVAAVVAAAARTIGELRAGMETRLVIGQAQGLLMGRLDIDEDQAFAYLKRRSMDENRKLVEIAREVVGDRGRPSISG